MKFRKTIDTFRLKMNSMFDGFGDMFDELAKQSEGFIDFDAVDAAEAETAKAANAEPAPEHGETVTTRREEIKPDGTKIITTVTRTKRVTVATSTSK